MGATVKQCHQHLIDVWGRNALRSKEIEDAVTELTDRAVLRHSDTLFALYRNSLLEKPHTYERKIGKLKCVVHTNTPICEADKVVVFLHGFGASPYHFFSVASSFFELAAIREQQSLRHSLLQTFVDGPGHSHTHSHIHSHTHSHIHSHTHSHRLSHTHSHRHSHTRTHRQPSGSDRAGSDHHSGTKDKAAQKPRQVGFARTILHTKADAKRIFKGRKKQLQSVRTPKANDADDSESDNESVSIERSPLSTESWRRPHIAHRESKGYDEKGDPSPAETVRFYTSSTYVKSTRFRPTPSQLEVLFDASVSPHFRARSAIDSNSTDSSAKASSTDSVIGAAGNSDTASGSCSSGESERRRNGPGVQAGRSYRSPPTILTPVLSSVSERREVQDKAGGSARRSERPPRQLRGVSGRAFRSPRVVFLLPFGVQAMAEAELGAVRDSVFGSFKWWDIFNRKKEAYGFDIFDDTEGDGVGGGAGLGGESEGGYEGKTVKRVQLPTAPTVLRRLASSPVAGGQWSPGLSPDISGGGRERGGGIGGAAYAQYNIEATPKQRYTVENPRGRGPATRAVLSVLAELEFKYKVPKEKMTVSGFSQGAMLTLDVLFHMKSPPASCAVFSGAPMCVHLWTRRLEARTEGERKAFSKMVLMQTIGSKDWVIPSFVQRWLCRYLVRQSFQNLILHRFEGAHEIAEQSLFNFHIMLLNDIARHHEQSRSSRLPSSRGAAAGSGEAGEAGGEAVRFRREVPMMGDVRNTKDVQRNLRASSKSKKVVDDIFYRTSYAVAGCCLPIARKILLP